MSGTKAQGLGVIALAGLVVGAMIGGGIFSLPQNMAQSASSGAVILSWVISGIGIFFLANTFRILAMSCPEATSGIYTYARMGFGPFAGFQIAWAYWLSNIFGNVGYAVLLMDAMDYFFPGVFTGGNNLWSILGGSVIIWIMNFAVLRGVRQAASLNVVGTFCKLIPIFLFIIIMLWVFRWSTFADSLSGKVAETAAHLHPEHLGSMMEQVRSTMMVTLWAFIGIEGAVVLSGRARDQRSVGLATVIGFLCCLGVYALLSILPFGYMTQEQLASLSNPSTAPLLEAAVHAKWGGDIMNLSVIVAILTSWLAFTIMVVQIPYAAACDGVFPAIFKRENSHDAPSVSLWVTSIIMQLAMIFVYFANNAWNTMLSVTSVMILPPYLASTLYLWKLCLTAGEKENTPSASNLLTPFALFCGVAGSIYAAWMIYAAGLKYLAMAFCFQVIGIPVYIMSRRHRGENGGRIFSGPEFIAALVITVIALSAVAAFASGAVKL